RPGRSAPWLAASLDHPAPERIEDRPQRRGVPPPLAHQRVAGGRLLELAPGVLEEGLDPRARLAPRIVAAAGQRHARPVPAPGGRREGLAGELAEVQIGGLPVTRVAGIAAAVRGAEAVLALELEEQTLLLGEGICRRARRRRARGRG